MFFNGDSATRPCFPDFFGEKSGRNSGVLAVKGVKTTQKGSFTDLF